MKNRKHGLAIVSLICQSLHAKVDYIRLLIDKILQKKIISPSYMFARNLVFFGNGSMSLLNTGILYDLHWALCI